jgi:hypothetical protein
MPRTPTETLMDALAECETAEDALILITHSDGTMGSHSTTTQLHKKLGMLEFWATLVRQDILRAGEVEGK